MSDQPLRTTPFAEHHRAAGARLAPFAGYEMPIRYEPGTIAEHLHTRSAAGLFDISHMGLVELSGPGHREWLETLLPAAIEELDPGEARYSFFTLESGGLLDDVILTAHDGRVDLVVNAGRRTQDLQHLESNANPNIEIRPRDDVAMLAIQGPSAADVVPAVMDGALPARFMEGTIMTRSNGQYWVSRSGYTGEDGFEVVGTKDAMVALADALLAHDAVAWAGLGARDSLRLEAGLCLYGNDLDETISPIEAGLRWAIPKRRRQGGFLGDEIILRQIEDGPPRRRVGLEPVGRAPVRHGAALHGSDGTEIGFVSSGGFGPSVDQPIAMGYVASEFAGEAVTASVRSKTVDCEIAALPFVPHRYQRG